MKTINDTMRLARAVFVSLFGLALVWFFIKFGCYERAHRIVPAWGVGILKCFGVQLDVKGRENLTSQIGYVVAASHASMLDCFIYPALLPPHTCFVAKIELQRIPIFASIFAQMRSVFVQRGTCGASIAGLLAHTNALPADWVVSMHPEGTRQQHEILAPFKKGFAHVAIERGVPVIPIVTRGGAVLCPRGSVVPQRGVVSVMIGKPMATRGLSVDTLVNQTHACMQEMLAQL